MSHRPRKRFGQNFLHDAAVVRRIVQAIDPQPDDLMVEIGPGTGILTRELLKVLHVLHAVEIDRDLISTLHREFPDHGLELHACDALRFDFTALAGDPHSLRVVGNLPYNISTPLLFHLLESRRVLRDMHFMLQREVVARLAAPPGSKTYGRLSVMAQLHCHVEALFRVGPGAFQPPPKVDSAVVRLRPREPLALEDALLPAFGNLVARAFAQRRKTLRNSLSDVLETAQIHAAGVDPSARPETLAVEDFVALTRRLEAARRSDEPVDKPVGN